MACKRNRILRLAEYLESMGLDVNIGKNKARGHRGVFIGGKNKYRIDISKDLEEDKVLSVIVHEFSHYVHFCYDKTLNSLDFLFNNYNEDIEEELINITVSSIPKEAAGVIFSKKEALKEEINAQAAFIKSFYPDFKLSKSFWSIEKGIKFPAKYLLKYDSIKYLNKIYSVNNLKNDFGYLTDVQASYIILRSKQRMLKRINSRILKMNKYYNRPSELFARFAESYFTSPDFTLKTAPISYKLMSEAIESNKIPELSNFSRMLHICNIM